MIRTARADAAAASFIDFLLPLTIEKFIRIRLLRPASPFLRAAGGPGRSVASFFAEADKLDAQPVYVDDFIEGNLLQKPEIIIFILHLLLAIKTDLFRLFAAFLRVDLCKSFFLLLFSAVVSALGRGVRTVCA